MVLSSQVDVVSVVFQTTSVGFSTVASTDQTSVVLIPGTFGAGDRTTDTKAFVIISDRSANAVAVLTQSFTTIVGDAMTSEIRIIFTAYATILALVLNSKVQAINQTEEVSVTVGREAVTTLLHKVVRTVSVATEFWQYVGPGSYVVNYAVVTTIVDRTDVLEFQTSKCHTVQELFSLSGALPWI